MSKLSAFAYTADISVLHINTHLYLVVTKYLFSVRVSRVDRLRTESRIGRNKKRKGKIYLLNIKIFLKCPDSWDSSVALTAGGGGL